MKHRPNEEAVKKVDVENIASMQDGEGGTVLCDEAVDIDLVMARVIRDDVGLGK
jgi:hypothetical protein